MAEGGAPVPAASADLPLSASADLPLSALLSQALVAFTIEVDNEFEHHMSHRTTNHGATSGSGRRPWLVSLPLWSNFLRFVEDDGITVAELSRRPGVEHWALPGMIRWGYVTAQGGTGRARGKQPPADAVVRLRPGGRRAKAVWSRLPDGIERRWRQRLGDERIDALRSALAAVVAQADRELPRYLPGGRYQMRLDLDRVSEPGDDGTEVAGDVAADRDLPALLSQALLLYATDYDRRSKAGLALDANSLRVMSAEPLRLRDLATRVGLGRETSDVVVERMAKWGLATIEPDPSSSRGKVARLRAEGLKARAQYLPTAAAVEREYGARYGLRELERLRAALLAIVEPSAERSPLWEGLEPRPEGWRAAVPAPECLPHYPLVTHRGGYPDGS